VTIRQANGFEIDDEKPMIPLTSWIKVMHIFEYHDQKAWVTMNEELNELGVPMYILANTEQELMEDPQDGQA